MQTWVNVEWHKHGMSILAQQCDSLSYIPVEPVISHCRSPRPHHRENRTPKKHRRQLGELKAEWKHWHYGIIRKMALSGMDPKARGNFIWISYTTLWFGISAVPVFSWLIFINVSQVVTEPYNHYISASKTFQSLKLEAIHYSFVMGGKLWHPRQKSYKNTNHGSILWRTSLLKINILYSKTVVYIYI